VKASDLTSEQINSFNYLEYIITVTNIIDLETKSIDLTKCAAQ
jgi:hypothetical protein